MLPSQSAADAAEGGGGGVVGEHAGGSGGEAQGGGQGEEGALEGGEVRAEDAAEFAPHEGVFPEIGRADGVVLAGAVEPPLDKGFGDEGDGHGPGGELAPEPPVEPAGHGGLPVAGAQQVGTDENAGKGGDGIFEQTAPAEREGTAPGGFLSAAVFGHDAGHVAVEPVKGGLVVGEGGDMAEGEIGPVPGGRVEAGLKGAGQPDVVGFEKGEPLPAGLREAEAQGGGQAVIGMIGMKEQTHARIFGGKGAGHVGGRVGGAVLKNEQLQIGAGLGKDAADGFGQPAGIIVAGGEDGDERCGHGRQGGWLEVTREAGERRATAWTG